MRDQVPARTNRAVTCSYAGLIAFAILGRAISSRLTLDPGFIAPLTSAATLLVGCYVALVAYPSWGALSAVWVMGAAAELLGIATGLPFGRYRYTDGWWPSVLLGSAGHFPVLVPFAWILVAGGSYVAMQSVVRGWLAILPAALVAALFDLLMEPVMVNHLRYWQWVDAGPLPGHAPWSNLVAWFGLSLAAGVIFFVGQKGRPLSGLGGFVALGGQLLLMAGLSFS